ncbi:DUF839 domain-containing protein [bacterium]|nr:DUF839 domain-containing protein [bacterium]
MRTLTLIFASLLMHSVFAQNPFPELLIDLYDAGQYPSDPDEVIVPASPIKYDVLFQGGVDEVTNKSGQTALAKEWQDFTGYVPINGRSDSGYVIVNHERIQSDAVNGDGGGMTVFTVYYNQNTKSWEVVDHPDGKFRNVDFSNVGGTGANCGGIQTSWGKVFTAEEWGGSFTSNAVIDAQGVSDTSDWAVSSFNGASVSMNIPKYMNYQYMVEVDVKNAQAIRKNYNMGRYDHEGGWIASDRKTVYLSDDYSGGSVMFKFVADVAEDFSKGTLYCYKQSEDGETGTWLPLTMNMNTMMNAREEAYKLGATVFMRLEWVEGIDDETVFITETGRGRSQSVAGAMRQGATLAHHLVELDAKDGNIDSTFNDIWGRVLRLNTVSGKMESALEGGGSLSKDYTPTNNHLSSPDGLVSTVINGRTFLVINEDMNPGGMPSTPAHFSNVLNEIYILDVTGDKPGVTYNVSQLRRFLVGPKGCETTGGRFTPDGSTYFVNIQHPASDNKAPFNHSVTLAVTGYQTIFDQSHFSSQTASIDDLDVNEFNVYPNPAARELHFSKTVDVALYNSQGQKLKVQREVNTMDISDLAAGTYYLITADGINKKIIVE